MKAIEATLGFGLIWLVGVQPGHPTGQRKTEGHPQPDQAGIAALVSRCASQLPEEGRPNNKLDFATTQVSYKRIDNDTVDIWRVECGYSVFSDCMGMLIRFSASTCRWRRATETSSLATVGMAWTFDDAEHSEGVGVQHLDLVAAVTGAVAFRRDDPDLAAAAVKLAPRPVPWFEDDLAREEDFASLTVKDRRGTRRRWLITPQMTGSQPWFSGRPRPSRAAFLILPPAKGGDAVPMEESDDTLVRSVAEVKSPREVRREPGNSIFESGIDLRQRASLIAIYHSAEDKHRWMGWVDGETRWLRADGIWLFGWTRARTPALRANDGILIVDLRTGVLRLLLANRTSKDDEDSALPQGDLCDVKATGGSLGARFEDGERRCHGPTTKLGMKAIEAAVRSQQSGAAPEAR